MSANPTATTSLGPITIPAGCSIEEVIKARQVARRLLGRTPIRIHEINIGGGASASSPTLFNFYRSEEHTQPIMSFVVNLFGGIYRWVSLPNQAICGTMEDFMVEVSNINDFYAHIIYTDEDEIPWIQRFTNYDVWNSKTAVLQNQRTARQPLI